MNSGKSIVELALEIDRQHKAAKDYSVNTSVLEMTPDAALAAGGKVFDIRDITHTQLSEFTKIPKKYYDRLNAEDKPLLATNVNHWLKKSAAPRMLRTLDGKARAFLSTKYRRVDNWQIAEAALPVIAEMPGLKVISSEVTERRMYLFAATDKIQGDVKVGDTLQMGIKISNSEVGYGRISVSPTILRLRCLNGLTIDEGSMHARHLGGNVGDKDDELRELFSSETNMAADKVLMMKVRDLIKNSLTETFFKTQLDRMKEATVVAIDGDPIKVAGEVAEMIELSQHESSSMLQNLIKEGDLTKWGLVNAVTALANTAPDYDRGVELMELGNDVLSLDPKAWNDLLKKAA